MSDEHPAQQNAHSAGEVTRSRKHSSVEHARALSAVQDRMEQLRRAEDASRLAGHAFRRALRDVTECQQALAEAAARLERVTWPRVTSSQGSV